MWACRSRLTSTNRPLSRIWWTNGRVAFFAKSWLGDYPDAENYLALFYSPNFSPAGPDKTHFKSAAYDKLYDEARRTQDVTKRTALYQAMDRIVVEESPVISLYLRRGGAPDAEQRARPHPEPHEPAAAGAGAQRVAWYYETDDAE